VGRGSGGRGQHLLALSEDREQELPHHCLEQLLLAREVEVERAARDPRARGDVVEPRRCKPTLDEALQRRRDDLLRPRLLAPAQAWLCCVVHDFLITNASVIYNLRRTELQGGCLSVGRPAGRPSIRRTAPRATCRSPLRVRESSSGCPPAAEPDAASASGS